MLYKTAGSTKYREHIEGRQACGGDWPQGEPVTERRVDSISLRLTHRHRAKDL